LSRRDAFTVVELLIAAAVSMLLMVILTEAFKAGIDMFRTARAQGQMMERLRTATTNLRDDLASYHFSSGDQTPGIGFTPTDPAYLSNRDLSLATYVPPQEGYFRIMQGPPAANANNPTNLPAIFDGTDSDGMLFSRATTHVLSFTVNRRETSPVVNNPVDPSYLFSVSGIPPFSISAGGPVFPRDFVKPSDFLIPNDAAGNATFSTRWAEVAYFLVANGNSAGGTPLFNLCRRVKLVLPITNQNTTAPSVVVTPPGGENPMISTGTTQINPTVIRSYNTSGPNGTTAPDVTQPRFRMCMGAASSGSDQYIAGLISPLAPTLAPTGLAPASSYRPLALDVAGTANANMAGDDIILSDVLSFEVKATWDGAPAPNATYNLGAASSAFANTDFPFDYLPAPSQSQNLAFQNNNLRVFDTWSNAPNSPYVTPVTVGMGTLPAWQVPGRNESLPLNIRIKALQIRIRIWDMKAQQTRQITIIQDM
jgi:hypothetical protein